MRRRAGTLIAFEAEILARVQDLSAAGIPEVHGTLLADELRGRRNQKTLIAYGTLYKALERLVEMGMLARRWEIPEQALAEKRPRRRLYRLTATGQRALALWCEDPRNVVQAQPVPGIPT